VDHDGDVEGTNLVRDDEDKVLSIVSVLRAIEDLQENYE
jgi:hypothetical protein